MDAISLVGYAFAWQRIVYVLPISRSSVVTIIVIGSKGQWAKRVIGDLIEAGLSDQLCLFDQKDGVLAEFDSSGVLLGHGEAATDSLLKHAPQSVIYIAVPPAERPSVICTLSEIDGQGARVVIEKPFLIAAQKDSLDALKEAGFEVFFIDHYLGKPAISSLAARSPEDFSMMEMCLMESDVERRPWMKQGSDLGGVIYDLAHHCFAILVDWIEGDGHCQPAEDMASSEKKGKRRSLKIQDIHIFSVTTKPFQTEDDSSGAPSDQEAWIAGQISYLTEARPRESGKLSFTIRVGKHTEKTLKVIRLYSGKAMAPDSLMISLSGNPDYASALAPELDGARDGARAVGGGVRCKALPMADTRAGWIDLAVTESAIRAGDVSLEKENCEFLLDEFKHRHSFFWNGFSKYLWAVGAVIALPLVVLLQLAESFQDEWTPPQMLTAIFVMAVFASVTLLLTRVRPVVDEHIQREDLRVRRVYNLYKSRISRRGEWLHVFDNPEKIGQQVKKVFSVLTWFAIFEYIGLVVILLMLVIWQLQ